MVERVRASRIKSGLTCEGVRLFGVGLTIECCRDCHQSDGKGAMSAHQLQWLDCPKTPQGVTHAQVCCRLNRHVRQAMMKGWPKTQQGFDVTVESLMAKQFAEHPSWVARHLPKVVQANFFDGVIESTNHKACRYIDIHSPHREPVQEVLCTDAECKECGASLHLYWSYTMQCWVPMKRYGMLDNHFGLSQMHENHGKCEVPGHVVMHQMTYVPEYAAYLCNELHGPKYAMNPMFGCAVPTQEGTKYVVHLVAGPINALKEMSEIVPLIEKVVNH